jgi:hypothetical protein
MITLAGLSYGVSAVNENRDTDSLKRFVKPFLNALSESFLRTRRAGGGNSLEGGLF